MVIFLTVFAVTDVTVFGDLIDTCNLDSSGKKTHVIIKSIAKIFDTSNH